MWGVNDLTQKSGPQRTAVVIAARNVRGQIAPTVRACRAIPSVDLIVVVDDGSDDGTGDAARGGGAVVVRHSVPRGRKSALETGVKVVAMRDREDWPARNILFIDPDLGDSAVEARHLVDAVDDGVADCAIGVEPEENRPNMGRSVERLAGQLVRAATGWRPRQPFATGRCVTRDVVDAVMPLSTGWGMDVGATIDLLVEGFSLVELPVDFEHHREKAWRRPRRRDVIMAALSRGVKMRRIPASQRQPAQEVHFGEPYSKG